MEISRHLTFSAGHRLTQTAPGHPCQRQHGHNYRLTIVVQGRVNAATGWVIDTKEIDRVLGGFRRVLDHENLNDLPFSFASNPTAENVLIWAWLVAEEKLGKLLFEIRLAETDKGVFSYKGDEKAPPGGGASERR